MASHGVGKAIIGRGAVREHDFAHELAHIPVELREVLRVAFRRVLEQPRRSALAAPIHGGDRKAAPAQIGNRLKVLLDELGAAMKEANGSEAALRRGIPARIADANSSAGIEGACDGSVRYRDCASCRSAPPFLRPFAGPPHHCKNSYFTCAGMLKRPLKAKLRVINQRSQAVRLQ